MARRALCVVVFAVKLERLVRVMTRSATYAAVVRITLAVEDAIRLKSDVVDLHALEQTILVVASMTGTAKVLRQLVTTQAARVENKLCVGLSAACCPPGP